MQSGQNNENNHKMSLGCEQMIAGWSEPTFYMRIVKAVTSRLVWSRRDGVRIKSVR